MTTYKAPERHRADNGIVYDQFGNTKDSDHIITIFNGMGVMPPKYQGETASVTDSYNGTLPALLQEVSGLPVVVAYHAACSGKPFRKGYYGRDVETAPLEAIMSTFKDKESIYPVYHSLATIPAMRRLLEPGYSSTERNLLAGTFISAVDNAVDALTRPDGTERTLFGIPYIKIFQLANWAYGKAPGLVDKIPVLPVSPARDQADAHDGHEKTAKNNLWRSHPDVDVSSAVDFLTYNFAEDFASCPINGNTRPLFVIPAQDAICSPKQQRKIASNIDAPVLEIETGHRWFTESPSILVPTIREILAHRERCLNERR